MFEDKDFDNKSALLFIDNNNFKSLNDQFGHLAGDEVLKRWRKGYKRVYVIKILLPV